MFQLSVTDLPTTLNSAKMRKWFRFILTSFERTKINKKVTILCSVTDSGPLETGPENRVLVTEGDPPDLWSFTRHGQAGKYILIVTLLFH